MSLDPGGNLEIIGGSAALQADFGAGSLTGSLRQEILDGAEGTLTIRNGLIAGPIIAGDVAGDLGGQSASGDISVATSLDGFFANAGVLFMGPDETITAAQKDLLVDVNIKGVIHAIDAAFPVLARTPGAHVVAMASTSAEYGSPQHAVYSATKFFVRGLTEALNIEYREHGIQVSAIYVAYVQTGMVFDATVKPASIERLGVTTIATCHSPVWALVSTEAWTAPHPKNTSRNVPRNSASPSEAAVGAEG